MSNFMSIDREDAKHMVGKGWHKILDMLYDELPIPKKLQVYQVKQKLGELRFYVSSATKDEYAIINNATKLSRITCEDCGNPAKIKTLGAYWLVCLCDKCFEVAKERTMAKGL